MLIFRIMVNSLFQECASKWINFKKLKGSLKITLKHIEWNLKGQHFSLKGYCKEQLQSSWGVLTIPLSSQAIQVWRNHSFSPQTPVLGKLEWLSFVFLRRKRRMRYTCRNKKKQGMMIEEDQWKEVLVKVVIMEKMPGDRQGRKRGRRIEGRKVLSISSWFNQQEAGNYLLLYGINSLVQVTWVDASMELQKWNPFSASLYPGLSLFLTFRQCFELRIWPYLPD